MALTTLNSLCFACQASLHVFIEGGIVFYSVKSLDHRLSISVCQMTNEQPWKEQQQHKRPTQEGRAVRTRGI